MKRTKKNNKAAPRALAKPTKNTIEFNEKGATFKVPLSMDNHKITDLGDPEDLNDAVPYSYVKKNFTFIGADNPFLPITGGTMKGSIDMNSNKIYNLKAPEPPKIEQTPPKNGDKLSGKSSPEKEANDQNAVTIQYLKDSCNVLRSNKDINEKTAKINNLINRVNNIKQLVGFESSTQKPPGEDTPDSPSTQSILPGGNYVPTAGGDMTGNLDMGGSHKATQLTTTPVDNDEGVCKQYLDENLLTTKPKEPPEEPPAAATYSRKKNTTKNKLIGDLNMNGHSINGLSAISSIWDDSKTLYGASVKTLKNALSNYTHPFLSGSISSPSQNTTLVSGNSFIWNPSDAQIIQSKSAKKFFYFYHPKESIPKPPPPAVKETPQPSTWIALLNRGLYLLTWNGTYTSDVKTKDNIFFNVNLVFKPYEPPEEEIPIEPEEPAIQEASPTEPSVEETPEEPIDNSIRTRVYTCRVVGKSTSISCQIPLELNLFTRSVTEKDPEYFLELQLGNIPPIIEAPNEDVDEEALVPPTVIKPTVNLENANWQLSVLNF